MFGSRRWTVLDVLLLAFLIWLVITVAAQR